MPVIITEDQIDFAFPEIHADARLSITVHRTLRVPDDDTTYGLPPGLGAFQLGSAGGVRSRPREWSDTDILLPMWQAEAAWFEFSSPHGYPFLLRMSTGGINAVNGERFAENIDFVGEDYFEVPEQPWLDGFRVDENTVRQFVAMPLGDGYTAAEQLAGSDDGAVRIQVTPLRSTVWATRAAAPKIMIDYAAVPDDLPITGAATSMGIGAGGSITQSIATPVEPQQNWNTDATVEATLRIVNSAEWESLTGTSPHHAPPTITDYLRHGYPWFEWYDDSLARRGESDLANVRTVKQVGEAKGEQPLPDNPSFDPPEPHVVGPWSG